MDFQRNRSDRSDGYNSGGDFRPRQNSFAPIRVGDEVEVTIEAVGEKGDGLAKVKGFVLFVPNAKEGSTVKVRVTRVLRKVGFAEIIGEGSAPAKQSASPQKKKQEQQEDEEPSTTDDEDSFEEGASADEEEAFEGEGD